jgi:hypothetical protein
VTRPWKSKHQHCISSCQRGVLFVIKLRGASCTTPAHALHYLLVSTRSASPCGLCLKRKTNADKGLHDVPSFFPLPCIEDNAWGKMMAQHYLGDGRRRALPPPPPAGDATSGGGVRDPPPIHRLCHHNQQGAHILSCAFFTY